MTICHETPSGQKQTWVLPEPAARAHLRQHPLDTEGPCEESVVVVEETSVTVMEPEPKATKKKK
jgi:hypothetical protein